MESSNGVNRLCKKEAIVSSGLLCPDLNPYPKCLKKEISHFWIRHPQKFFMFSQPKHAASFKQALIGLWLCIILLTNANNTTSLWRQLQMAQFNGFIWDIYCQFICSISKKNQPKTRFSTAYDGSIIGTLWSWATSVFVQLIMKRQPDYVTTCTCFTAIAEAWPDVWH